MSEPPHPGRSLRFYVDRRSFLLLCVGVFVPAIILVYGLGLGRIIRGCIVGNSPLEPATIEAPSVTLVPVLASVAAHTDTYIDLVLSDPVNFERYDMSFVIVEALAVGPGAGLTSLDGNSIHLHSMRYEAASPTCIRIYCPGLAETLARQERIYSVFVPAGCIGSYYAGRK